MTFRFQCILSPALLPPYKNNNNNKKTTLRLKNQWNITCSWNNTNWQSRHCFPSSKHKIHIKIIFTKKKIEKFEHIVHSWYSLQTDKPLYLVYWHCHQSHQEEDWPWDKLPLGLLCRGQGRHQLQECILMITLHFLLIQHCHSRNTVRCYNQTVKQTKLMLNLKAVSYKLKITSKDIFIIINLLNHICWFVYIS